MSKETLVLDNPILINGKEVKELTYDAKEITVDLFTKACAMSAAASQTNGFTMKVKETDFNTHLYLGMAAVIAVNPHIDFSDLERIKGFDLLDLSNIGAFFTYRKSAETSEENNAEGQSETTPDTSTQASEK